ncbi:DUF2855 family protein [Amycolatopsis cihanbeyliensis]|uniref:Uncharacterized protein DUF2855 n=1 Tax=Amycolatopsis cihanbeyliensis TaxID=1128664 RepID=A0A542DQ65_AMYCI|nr:DUF2855 family protein [Amycolatopsis cihanbeyliensis]TQJ05249.1 uncharacterized protein DUF2855 [Amycolatopsis cihanbeyliensis]
MSPMDAWDLLFERDDLTRYEVRQATSARLRPGQVRLAVERFGITTVTATYALFGDSPLRFFDVFPAPEGFGRVPVWGFARVVESRAAGIVEGSRFFGYFPTSTHHIVTPEAISGGFIDTEQKAVPHDWYRTYETATPEADELDDRRALLHPLFPCSFTLADAIGKHATEGVKSVLISSASCKTAIGLADLLARRDGISVTGVTSGEHKAFARGLELYDSVVAYDELGADAVPSPALFVDFTNSAERIRAVYRHAGAQLTTTFLAGFTHPSTSFAPPEVGDPQPQPYFTPAVEEQTMAEVGADAYKRRYREAEEEFLTGTRSWLVVQRGNGPDAIADAFRTVLAGEQKPAVGAVLTP